MSDKAERTRQYILEKAAHVFNTKGYHGTSMSDILEATGLAKGGLYGNFESKETLALEAFRYAFGKIAHDLSQRIKSGSNASEKLNTVIDYYYNYLDKPTIEGGCPVLNYTGQSGDLSQELRTAICQAANTMLQTLIHIMEKGKTYGQIRQEVNTTVWAELIYSRIEGAIMLSKAFGDPHKLNRLLDLLKAEIQKEICI